jgi:antitoxin PrlF
MAHPLQTESTLTDRYQTTIPDAVRKVLHLKKRDKIQYIVQPDGHVLISKVEENHDDPVIDNFLSFLAKDMQHHPQRLSSISSSLLNRIESVVTDVTFNLDEELSDDGDLISNDNMLGLNG